MSNCRQKSAEGFTLVELLVALFIFALVASISMSFLYQTLDSKTVLENRTAALQEFKVARALLKLDLLHLVQRPTRGTYGEAATPSFSAGLRRKAEPFLTLVRGGAGNPGGFQAKSQLQHVTYILKGSDLVRQVRSRLDPASATPVDDHVILKGVRRLDIKFLVEGRWQNRLVTTQGQGTEIPQAISLEMELSNFGKVTQAFLIAESGSL